MHKKVLIITYFFPPKLAVASVRLKGIAKYLPKFGWEPFILTTKLYGEIDPSFNIIQTPYNGDLKDLAQRAFNYSLPNWLWQIIGFPDEYKNWKKIALKYAREYLKNNKIDAVLSSSSPYTTHLIARQLKKEFDIPWVADLRDLWSYNHNYEHSKLRLSFEKIYEKNILSDADAITTVSDPLVKIQSAFLKSNKVYCVSNGFDPDDYIDTELLSKKFNITYAGKVYENHYNSDFLFNAIKELLDENLIDREDIRVNFWGPTSNQVKQNINNYNLQDIVCFCGTVSHKKILEEQRKSQLLLYMNWEDEFQKGIYQGKIFEYLCVKRPILITGGSNNIITDLIDKTKAGKFVKNDLNELKRTLLDFYEDYKKSGKVTYTGIETEINKFNHIEMARKFSNILNNCSTKKKQINKNYANK